MNKIEINRIMREIEILYRDEYDMWGKRIAALRRVHTEYFLLKVVPFSDCSMCLSGKGGPRGFCPAHAPDAERIVNAFWERATPWGSSPEECPECGAPMATAIQEVVSPMSTVRPTRSSIDHILPISLGGLEWDRNNLRWICLRCNTSRGNRHKVLPGKQSRLDSIHPSNPGHLPSRWCPSETNTVRSTEIGR